MVDKILRANSTQIPNVQSCTFKEQVNSDENLRFGSVAASSIEFVAYGSQTDAPASGEQLTYYQTDDNGVDTLIGIFTAQPSIPSKNTYRVIAYDNIIDLKADFTEHLESIQGNFPMTLNALMSEVASVAGVVFANTPSAGTTTIEAFSASGVNCQQVVAWAAEMSGQFVRCNTSGEIEFAWYVAAGDLIVKPGSGSSGSMTFVPYRENGLDYRDYAVDAVARVAVQPPETDGVAAIYPSGSTGNTYTVQDNLLLTGASVSTLETIAQNLYTVLSALPSYRPCDISLFRFDNPFRAGDIVDVEDIQGVAFKTLVMAMTSANDGASISCTGKKNYEADAPNVSRQLVNLAENVVRIDKLKVGWAEIDSAIIDYLTANDVTAQNLTIVDANDNVIATFNDSGITFYNSNGDAIASYSGANVVLGDADGTRAEIDNNSFELYDRNLFKYVSIGDDRDDSGVAAVVMTYIGDGSKTAFQLSPVCNMVSSIEVTVDGVVSTDYDILYAIQYTTANGVSFHTAPSNAASIVIEYTTTSGVYHYDFGTRKSGSHIGLWSIVAGQYQEASGSHSAAVGGIYNEASGWQSAVVGGTYNKSVESASAVVGGSYNEANGYRAAVVGGNSNEASGYRAAVVGGTSNESQGANALAIGVNSIAKNANQFVFGRYNEQDTSANPSSNSGNYVEIVGNGNGVNARSNARTLDWNGNETLAGMLYCNGGDVVALRKMGVNSATSYPSAVGMYAVVANIFSNITPSTYYGLLTIDAVGNYQRHMFNSANGDVYVGWREASTIAEPSAWKTLTTSVNGKTGTVTLNWSDVGALQNFASINSVASLITAARSRLSTPFIFNGTAAAGTALAGASGTNYGLAKLNTGATRLDYVIFQPGNLRVCVGYINTETSAVTYARLQNMT